jgi:hypothetical protein
MSMCFGGTNTNVVASICEKYDRDPCSDCGAIEKIAFEGRLDDTQRYNGALAKVPICSDYKTHW